MESSLWCDCLLQAPEPRLKAPAAPATFNPEAPMHVERAPKIKAQTKREREGQDDDVSDSHILDDKCSWVWEHFKPYKVKTLLSVMRKRNLCTLPNL